MPRGLKLKFYKIKGQKYSQGIVDDRAYVKDKDASQMSDMRLSDGVTRKFLA